MNSETGSARNTIASKLLILADQADRDAWTESRRGGLGGSDMAAICGESSFKRAIDVWNSIRGDEPAADEFAGGDRLDRLEMGHILEPRILDMYATGRWRPAGDRHLTVWRPPLVARRGREWHRGSCDGLGVVGVGAYLEQCGALADLCPPVLGAEAADPDAEAVWWSEIAEVKTHGYHAGIAYDVASWSDDDVPVPPDKLIQCGWYAELWEVARCSLLALIDTHLRRYWHWIHDPKIGADLLTIGEDWWRRHIVEGWTPDPDGSERYRQHLRRLYPKDAGRTVRASADLDAVVAQLKAARANRKASEAEVDRLEQVIQASMGDASTLETHLGKITWKLETGRVKLRPAADEAYRAAGWSPVQIMEHEDRHRGAQPRVFRVPQAWSRK